MAVKNFKWQAHLISIRIIRLEVLDNPLSYYIFRKFPGRSELAYQLHSDRNVWNVLG